MRFSLLLAVVATLTASIMSVSACTDQNGLCGASNVGGDPCCSGLTCKLGRPKPSLVLPVAFSRLASKTEDVRDNDRYSYYCTNFRVFIEQTLA
ncbi:uncharacterized protein HD556DRAFT_125665 [Suillus plorans]|uniref:Hydrophobin n=1 Tax=Suillus plorans TaxID=116603 RepID=A0A9P7J1L9_9AGAM|nr:uncharacterized protein HD556DRAFT_125665 [Suillus plorans]KAG1799378.1 hypothetical protein HD556DRAFT_125665 [Suillus plorans]